MRTGWIMYPSNMAMKSVCARLLAISGGLRKGMVLPLTILSLPLQEPCLSEVIAYSGALMSRFRKVYLVAA